MTILLYILAILFVAGGVAALIFAIILPKRLKNRKHVFWRAGFIGLSVLFIIAGVWMEGLAWESKRFNTVEEMTESCIRGEQLKDVIYYEDYAVLYIQKETGDWGDCCIAQKDEKGWRAYQRNSKTRLIRGFLGNMNILALEINEEGLDFICVEPNYWDLAMRDNPEDFFQHKVTDSAGREFAYKIVKGLDRPIYYTFADADVPGYEVSIDEESISISQSKYNLNNIYTVGENNISFEDNEFPIVIAFLSLIGAILTGIFAYKQRGKGKVLTGKRKRKGMGFIYKRKGKGLIVGCIICVIFLYLSMVMIFL